ncbi:MAG: M15 family metallopeptidase [Acidimicrobiia bacterium]|nr:M15 family metallopeptidase [Acidimicrobiia bacterium]
MRFLAVSLVLAASFDVSSGFVASARLAQDRPPIDANATRRPDLVELVTLDSTIKLDIRYAGTNNFLGKPVYKESRAFLQRPAAMALLQAHRDLAKSGYGLLIHDGYRPWAITKLFWDMTSGSQREFVADPRTGSKHNRGAAVDLTLYDLNTGRAVEMPGGYDEMTERSYPDYQGGTAEQRQRRDLLRRAMESHGFTVEPNEWWHFNFKDWQLYPILDIAFSDIK